MAKTVFTDGDPGQGLLGTIVTAEFLNKVFNHRHDGADADGSCPIDYAADTGGANAYVIELAPAITAHISGLPITFKATNANTGASTIAINGMGAVSIKRPDGGALLTGDIVAGQIVTISYNGAAYQVISAVSPAAATETVAGIVELATTAEVQAGTDTARAITPAGMKAGLNAGGSAPTYACRAWVNFNGTGTVAIRGSGNISSITDNGTGDYTLNFTTAMPDVDYSVSGSCCERPGWAAGNASMSFTAPAAATATPQTASYRLWIQGGAGGLHDTDYIYAAIYR